MKTNDDYIQQEHEVLEYFGITRINDYIHVQKRVLATLPEEFYGEVLIKENGMAVDVGKRGIKETFGDKRHYEYLPRWFKIAKLATVTEIPDLLRRATVRDSNIDNYHEGKTSKYDYLETETEVLGTECIVGFDIKKTEIKNRFHLHRVEIKKRSEA